MSSKYISDRKIPISLENFSQQKYITASKQNLGLFSHIGQPIF